MPNLVVEETHVDELTITSHPVERGAAITDHAFKRPSEVTVRYGWSNSSGFFDIGSPSPDDVYKQLLALQESRVPFDMVTGKRMYQNMLIKTLAVTTDAATENSLMVVATLQQIIIVQTSTVTLQPTDVQASPEKTASTANSGTKQPQAATASILYKSVTSIKSAIGF
ncbi:phage baseplate protein [Burkholderia sp. PAMC 28687]|uniref:phage baseplate protein n=1 Tax=Burkholderia sp. PAMC 28687 TaxID=1795874 RepID=UPI0018D2AEB6|nr:hypothetical protein [Burkholderia sp. PAMC 28687]